jgi:hypothetical protein
LAVKTGFVLETFPGAGQQAGDQPETHGDHGCDPERDKKGGLHADKHAMYQR